MLPRCLPPSFRSIRLTVQEQITTEDFQDGCHGRSHGYDILMEMSKMWKVTDGYTDEGRTMVNRPWHKLTWSKAPGELTIEDLQDGCCGDHRGYRNKFFLAILNFHVTPTPPTKFWLNLTYHSRADEVWRFSWWPPWWPSQISNQNYFSNSESLCHSDASHQVWAQSALRFGRRCLLKNFKMAPMAAISNVRMELI